MTDSNGWNEYQKLVLHELHELNLKFDKNSQDIQNIREQVAKLKVKSGVWGAIGGMIPIIIALVLIFLSK